MKTIRFAAFGGPDVLKFEDVPTPTPKAGQLLVSIKAAGVNPVDTYIRAGQYGERAFPFTPGSDGAGIVAEAGIGINDFKPGDRVYLDGALTGTYATHALCEASQLHPLPDALTFPQGAALGVPYLTAARALFQKANVRKGEWVLVHGGSGGVGLAAIQLAKAAGARVAATAGTEKGREACRREGAELVLDHASPSHGGALLDKTDGRGADVILEMLANANLGTDLTIVAKRGRVVVIGSRGPVSVNPRDAMSRDAVVYGMSLFNCPMDERLELHERLAAGIKSGAVKPVVGREFPLAEAAKAHEAVLTPGALGKIVLIP